MAQQVRGLFVNTDNLSSDPRIHMVEGKNLSHVLSSDLHAHTMAPSPPSSPRQ